MSVLTPAMKTAWEETNKSAGFIKGDEFEQYIRNTLFPRESYDVLYKAHDYADNMDEYLTYRKLPDYKFRAKNMGMDFFIEAKFRARFQDQVPEWRKLFQLKDYQEIDNITPVMVVIGLGGRPAAPERVFLVPFKHLKFVKLYPGFLQKYVILPDRSVSENLLRRIMA